MSRTEMSQAIPLAKIDPVHRGPGKYPTLEELTADLRSARFTSVRQVRVWKGGDGYRKCLVEGFLYIDKKASKADRGAAIDAAIAPLLEKYGVVPGYGDNKIYWTYVRGDGHTQLTIVALCALPPAR